MLYEGPGSLPLEPDARSRLMTALLDKGFAVTSLRKASHVTALAARFPAGPWDVSPVEPPQLDGGVAMRFQQIDGMDAAAVVEAAEKLLRRYRRGESRRLEAVVPGDRLPAAAPTACSA